MSSTLAIETAPPRAGEGTTWRNVLRGAGAGQLVMAGYMVAVTAIFERRLDPMPIVIAAVVAIGVWWLGRASSGRGAVAFAGVVSLLLLLMMLAFGGLATLLRPQSTFELILVGGLLVVSALGLIALPGAWRASPPSAGAALAPRAAAAVIGLLVVVGVVAGILRGSATRMTGDLVLQAKDYGFSEPVLTADAGRVAVFIDNRDVASHDFTIKGVVQQSLPGQKAGRAVFDVKPGSYRFYCSLHPDMEGTLRVS
jgi:plastocyanin